MAFQMSENGAGSRFPVHRMPAYNSHDEQIVPNFAQHSSKDARAPSPEPVRHLLVGYRMSMQQPNTFGRLPGFAEIFVIISILFSLTIWLLNRWWSDNQSLKSNKVTSGFMNRVSTPYVNQDSSMQPLTPENGEETDSAEDSSKDSDQELSWSKSRKTHSTKRSRHQFETSEEDSLIDADETCSELNFDSENAEVPQFDHVAQGDCVSHALLTMDHVWPDDMQFDKDKPI